MANHVLESKIIIRNDTKANWISFNPVLLKGEMGIETDTSKMKIGDGVSNWNDLGYANSQTTVLMDRAPGTEDSDYDVGSKWINTTAKTAYINVDNTPNQAIWQRIATADASGKVIASMEADKLSSARTISISGDATGSASFDGTEDKTIEIALKNDRVSAGEYVKPTVNSKGLVMGGNSLLESDIPVLNYTKISGLGTVATKNTGTGVGEIPQVNGEGKIEKRLIPALNPEDAGAEPAGTSDTKIANHNEDENSHQDIRNLARGRQDAIVFESKSDLETWLSDDSYYEHKKADMYVGREIYTKTSEDDYWVSRVPVNSLEDLTVLEIRTIDLSGYVPNTRTVNSKALNENVVLDIEDILNADENKKISVTKLEVKEGDVLILDGGEA